MTKNTIKKWKNPNVLLIGQNTYFRVFPPFGGTICQMILFSNFLSKFFNGKQNLVEVFCGQTLF